MIWRKRYFSSDDLIFCDTEILLLKGMRTIKRPVKEISVVSRGPFDEIGSLATCTISFLPRERTSVIVPCLSMSGSVVALEMFGTCRVSLSVFSRN